MAANSANDENGHTTRPGEIKWPIFNRPRIFSEDREEDERKRIDFYTVEVCQWLKELLGIEIKQENFMDKLYTGVELCRLQNKLIATLGGEKIDYHADAEKYSQFARQNVEHFINWCKGLNCHQRFESNDLVDQKSEQKEINEQRRKCVVVCLRQIKQKYNRALHSTKETKVSKGEEDGGMEDDIDSTNPISKTQVTSKPDQSDSTRQHFDLPPVQEDDNVPKDEDDPTDENEPKEQIDDDKLKEQALEDHDKPNNKVEPEDEDKSGDTDEPEVASSSEDSVFDNDNEPKPSTTTPISNKPSEEESSEEKGEKSTTKSDFQVYHKHHYSNHLIHLEQVRATNNLTKMQVSRRIQLIQAIVIHMQVSRRTQLIQAIVIHMQVSRRTQLIQVIMIHMQFTTSPCKVMNPMLTWQSQDIPTCMTF